MFKRKSPAQPRNPFVCRARAYLVKGYCTGLLGLVTLILMLGFFGFTGLVELLVTSLTPWLVRLAITISCVLVVTSVSESI
jgi:hypothetical protein